MALATDQTVTGTGASVASLSTASWTPAANDLILVWVACRSGITASAVSGNGITFVKVVEDTEDWFAAAKSGDTQLTKTGYVIGSPKYMAPEQILGKKVDERADIYSLGVIAYEMLAGNPPYSRGDHMSVMYQHVQGKAQPLQEANPSVPRDLADVITKAMSVDKMKRYASMDEFRLALETVVPNLK